MTATIEPETASSTATNSGVFWKQAFTGLVEQYPEPVFVIDDEGKITSWNDDMVDLLGYTANEVMGQNAYEVFGTEGEDETLAETVLRGGRADSGDGYPDRDRRRRRAVPLPSTGDPDLERSR